MDWKKMRFVNEVNTKIYRVSTTGDVVDITNDQTVESYTSSNGHRYLLLNTLNGDKRLYLQENIVALTFLNVPKYLSQRPIKVIHDDNDFLNNESNNLKFIEFIEEWKPIVIDGVNTDYFISNIGNVKSIKYGKSKIMTPQNGPNKSIKINLRINGEYTNEFIHRLVATAFVPNPNLCEIVNHIDGRRNNPNYLNLEWCTSSQNTKHAVLTGLHKNFHIGSENPASKYDENIIHMVCKMWVEGYTMLEIVNTLNVSKSLIHRILYENRWDHITSQYDLHNRNRK